RIGIFLSDGLRVTPELVLNAFRSAYSLLNVVRPDSFQTSVHIVSQQCSNFLAPIWKHACTQVGSPNRVGLVEQYLPAGVKTRGCQTKGERQNKGKQTERSPNHGADGCLLLLLVPATSVFP